MCAHSSSGKAITEKISNEIYPFIDAHVLEVIQYLKQAVICSEASVLFDMFYNLKSQYESLKHYNRDLVFPAVLKVFDTKDIPGITHDVNITELQENTLAKEKALMQLLSDIEHEAEFIQLPADHAIFRLINAFRTRFADSKREWNNMLQNWNKTCACFAAANNQAGVTPKQVSIEYHG